MTEFVKSKCKRYEPQAKRKRSNHSLGDWLHVTDVFNYHNIFAMYKLTYQIGSKVVQEWNFASKPLAYWQKSVLLNSGQYELGKFKVTPC